MKKHHTSKASLMIWYFLNDIILRSFYNYSIFNAANVYLTLRQSIKLLTIEYQRGHTSYEERAHFLVFKKWRGAPYPSAPLFFSPCLKDDVISKVEVFFGQIDGFRKCDATSKTT